MRGAVQNVCIHVHLELGEPLCDAAGYLEILCGMCTILFSNARKAQMLLSKGLGMPTKQLPWLNP